MDASVLSYQGLRRAIGQLFHAADNSTQGVRAAMVDGPPGVGKTAMKQYIAQDLGLAHVFQLKLSHHDVTDVSGVPVPDMKQQRTFFYPSGDMLPDPNQKGGTLVVLDEIGDCNIAQQNLACQMVFEHRIHSYKFPERTFFLLTANRVGDRSGANRIVTKLGSRVAYFTLAPMADELFVYGAGQGWNPTLLAFLKMHGSEPINPAKANGPTYFNSFDPDDPFQQVKPVFACSRTYEFASAYLNYVDEHSRETDASTVNSVLASLLGTAVSSKLASFRATASRMPDPDLILKSPDKVPFPEEEEVLWALTLTLTSKVQKNTVKQLHAFLKRGPAEYLALATRVLFDSRMSAVAGEQFNKLVTDPTIRGMYNK